jgi:hypothetical protein
MRVRAPANSPSWNAAAVTSSERSFAVIDDIMYWGFIEEDGLNSSSIVNLWQVDRCYSSLSRFGRMAGGWRNTNCSDNCSDYRLAE